jgi:hypothetical protein
MKSNIALLVFLCMSCMGHAQQAPSAADIARVEQQLKEACLRHETADVSKHAIQLASITAYGAEKLEYALNLLQSVEQNGWLITGGKGDTYPLITLQQVRAIRPDVQVIQAAWLEDSTLAQWISQACNVQGTPEEIIRQLAASYPVYISLAAPTIMLDALEQQLYCTGLAFKCSTNPIANVKGLYNNWWKNCAKNHLDSGYALNANYLMPLALIASYVSETNTKTELKSIKQTYATIAKSVAEKEQIPGMK